MALLIGLLFPVLGQVRHAARATVCASGMRQWGIAVQAYMSNANDRLPSETGDSGVAANGDATPGAWFNALPRLIDAPTYAQIYAGSSVGSAGGYKNEWIWYCPTLIARLDKNSGSGKNSFHYGMNALLNGTGSFPRRDGSRNNPKHIAASLIANPSATIFLIESFRNVPAATPRDVDLNRHFSQRLDTSDPDGSVNTLFIDGHVALYPAGPLAAVSGTSPFTSMDTLEWGPFPR